MKRVEGLSQASEDVTEVSVARDLEYLWRSLYGWLEDLDFRHSGFLFEEDDLVPLHAVTEELASLVEFFNKRADEVYGEDGASRLRQKMSDRWDAATCSS